MRVNMVWQSLSSVAHFLPLQGKERILRPILKKVSGDVVVKVRGIKMKLDLSDYLQRCIFLGCLEQEESNKIKQLLPPGGAGIDVGANCGGMSALFADQVGTDGLVLAFEPNPRLLDKLLFLKENNHLPQLEIHPVGLGEVEEKLEISLPPPQSGNEDATLASIPGWERKPVTIRPLDDVLLARPTVHFSLMKVDVEGFELQVLKGASSLLCAGRVGHLLIEFNCYWLSQQDTSPHELWDFILSKGFLPLAEKRWPQGNWLKNFWFRHSSQS